MFSPATKTATKDLLTLAWPVILARLGIMTMGLTDVIVVGNYSSRELAFSSLALAPTAIVVTTAVGLMMGVQVMTARLLGEGRRAEVGGVLRRGVAYSLQLGVAALLIMVVFGPWGLRHRLSVPSPSVPSMDLGLEGRHAFVSASTGGIGAEIARRLSAEGCRVLVHGRDAGRAERLAAGLEGADTVLGDLTDADQAAAVAERAVAWGTEILVNNAGPFAEGTWAEAGPDDWLATMDDNVATVLRVVQPLLPSMTARGWGRIVNIGSRAVRTPLPDMAAYSAAKAAVVNLTGSLAAHLAGTGVTANVVSPGVIATESLREMLRARGRENGWGEQWEERAVAEYAPNPTGRMGTPADVAAVVVFLAGEPAGYVNGAEVRVDGGI